MRSQRIWRKGEALPLLSQKGKFGFINPEAGQVLFIDVNEKILRWWDYWWEKLNKWKKKDNEDDI